MQIPQKAPGTFYAVVLRSEGFSYRNTARRGATGGSDVIPIPDLGALCVCCNGATDGHTHPFSLTDASDNFEAPPLDVPVCPACTDHAAENTGAAAMVGIMIPTGIALAVLGFVYYDRIWVGALGVAIAGLALAWAVRARAERKKGTMNGHHPGASLMASPRQCVVRTTNRALVERVVARNASQIFKVR